jgi:CheY-like chemotaxis protein
MRGDLEQIVSAGKRATDLSRQLLAFSRRQVLQPRVIDLGVTLTGMTRMLARVIGEDIDLSVYAPREVGLVHVDPGQIEQVVLNLVVNARDAMPQGGKLRIEVAKVDLDETYAASHLEARPGPHVMLTIADTGVGMDKATRARIFEPFFTTKPPGKGTGLGLATVFGIVKQSGGNIWVYSEPGKGSVFKIYLPRSGQAADTVTSKPPPRSYRGMETILLVEDDEQVRKLACSILQRSGYHVIDAASGGDALIVCEQYQGEIHLLVTDVVMPRMSGGELAERVARMRPTTRVLFTSGYADDAIVQHGVLHARVPFVQKPLLPAIFLAKVRDVLDESRDGDVSNARTGGVPAS